MDQIELLKDSIFDTEQIKQTKVFIAEIQQYREEVQFMEQNKKLLEKAKEKKEEEVHVTEAFSKAPENAADFKPVTFTLKKRVISEITKDQNDEKKQDESSQKILK